MKKHHIIGILMLAILFIGGCSKKEVKIKIDKVSEDTFFVNQEDKIELIIAEDFKESHYDLIELENFIEDELKKHNDILNEEVVSLKALVQNKNQAIMQMEFLDIHEFNRYLEVDSDYFILSEATKEQLSRIPDELLTVKKGKTILKEDIISSKKNKNYKVIILDEAYDVLIDGSIICFNEGTTVTSKNSAKSMEDAQTIIIFK